MAKYTIKKQKDNKKGKASKKLKEQKVLNDNELEIRNFFIILVIVLVIVLALYFASKAIVSKRSKTNTNTNTTATEVDYSLATVGTILNRPYDDYYVMVYNSEDTDAIYYANLFTKYNSKENSLKIYFCDLNNPLNKDYISEEETGNPYARTTDDFSFGKITLLRVRYGQVITYLEDIDQISNALK